MTSLVPPLGRAHAAGHDLHSPLLDTPLLAAPDAGPCRTRLPQPRQRGRAGALGRRAGELLVSRRAAPSRGAAVQAIDRALRAAEREAGAPLGTEAAQSLGALAADVRRLREATRLLLRRARGRLPRPRGASEGGVAAPAKETGCMRREAIGSTYQKHSVWLMVRRA
ncbi:unnamed protein product, partial [Prorocentrum cordatum]